MLFILSDFIHTATLHDPHARRWNMRNRRFWGHRPTRDNH